MSRDRMARSMIQQLNQKHNSDLEEMAEIIKVGMQAMSQGTAEFIRVVHECEQALVSMGVKLQQAIQENSVLKSRIAKLESEKGQGVDL